MTSVPFLDLKTQYAGIRAEILAAVERLLDSGQYVLGDEVAAFEREFASAVGAAHGVGMNSGTSAIQLALLAAGVGPGDEVITVPHTFVATVAAIEYVGARPVLVDIDPASFTMNPALIEQAVTARTKAVLPVHLYGQSADMDPILAVARRHGLVVIEDAAQAHLAAYRGRPCGSMGDLAAFSFYPGKNLGAYGEGGIAVTGDAGHAKTLRMLRDWGQEAKYKHVLKGFNARLEGLQGAILRVKLRYLQGWTDARRAHAALYGELLRGVDGVGLPEECEGRRHVYHIYAVRVADRPGFREFLDARGVSTGIHYPHPVHLLDAYRGLGHGAGDFPEAERAASEVVSLPMYPEMTEQHVRTVADAVKEWVSRR